MAVPRNYRAPNCGQYNLGIRAFFGFSYALIQLNAVVIGQNLFHFINLNTRVGWAAPTASNHFLPAFFELMLPCTEQNRAALIGDNGLIIVLSLSIRHAELDKPAPYLIRGHPVTASISAGASLRVRLWPE